MLRTRLIALLTATALAATTAACGGSDDSSNNNSSAGSPDKVKVGVIPIVDVAPIYLGKAKGFFSKQNIDLTLEQAQGGAAIVPAVVSGQYQFGFSNVVSLLLGASRTCRSKWSPTATTPRPTPQRTSAASSSRTRPSPARRISRARPSPPTR